MDDQRLREIKDYWRGPTFGPCEKKVDKARKDVADLVAEVERLNNESSYLRGRLTTIEWIGICEEKYCPACKEHIRDGHDLSCWLGKALERV